MEKRIVHINSHTIFFFQQMNKHQTFLWVGVYENKVEYYLENLGISRKYPIHICPQPNETEKIIDEMINTSEVNNSYVKIKTIAKLYEFFSSLYDMSAECFSDVSSVYDIHGTDTHDITYLSENIYIREAENYIRFHYDSDITISRLAKLLNLSAEYFSRLFKVETGMTPQNMIIQYRCWINIFRQWKFGKNKS